MAGKTVLDRMARGNAAVTVLTGQVASATGGTQSSHTHGLTDGAGNPLTPIGAIAVPTATAVDHASNGLFTTGISIVSMSSTVVVVRAGTASATFTLLIW